MPFGPSNKMATLEEFHIPERFIDLIEVNIEEDWIEWYSNSKSEVDFTGMFNEMNNETANYSENTTRLLEI